MTTVPQPVLPGQITRAEIAKINTDSRLIKWLDSMQALVFGSPFNNTTDPVASVAAATISLPIVINGTQYYIKLSTTP